MTSLWQCYWENDIDKFRRLLPPTGYSQTPSGKAGAAIVGSPIAFGSSPRSATKPRKPYNLGPGATRGGLAKTEINSRDHCGLTLLLRVASSTSPSAVDFAEALLANPAVDIYAKDPESGWNALHRALYNGNISVARLLLEKERRDLTESLGAASTAKIGQLIKTKDHEGNSPFDLYNATIALRSLKTSDDVSSRADDSEVDEGVNSDESMHPAWSSGLGEEVFTFGSNNNLSLGLGDEDDRQYPERVYLKRPDHLIRHLYDEYLQKRKHKLNLEASVALDDPSEVPALIQNHPLVIQNIVLSKLHSAILTTDPISNLYICGVGRGGRLGLGDENTQFSFTPVQGALADKKVVHVALGQNHTMAITSDGGLWTWGSNAYSNLGYTLPPPLKPDEEPISTTPRQVFGPLKKEIIVGAAASTHHSVVHTGSSLFCWGRNVGQLGLMDADSRSLEVQTVPRKIGATLISNHSSIISAVSAIDRATCCLFGDRSLVIFTSYGFKMINLQSTATASSIFSQKLMGSSSSFHYDPRRREIHHIASGADTIAAVTGSGDLFTMQLNNQNESNQLGISSTTNPAKIKDAIAPPQCIWTSRKDGVKSVDVGENGSVMISTESGAVWRRVKRTKAQDTRSPGSLDYKRKDFKFQRVPYITDVVAVRCSTFGAFAAVRKDCDVTRDQLEISEPTLWRDVSDLLPLNGFKAQNFLARENKDTFKFHNPERLLKGQVDELSYAVLTSTDLEEDLKSHMRDWEFSNERPGVAIRSASSHEISLPVHSWVISARSPVLRMGLQRFRETGHFEIPDLLTIIEDHDETIIQFIGCIDTITMLNLLVYAYSDRVVPAWNFTRQAPPLAHRYRQIRSEVMKIATRLGMPGLETAARTQTQVIRSMGQDFRSAIEDAAFFEDGDALLELDGDEIPVHSSLLCQRCPWFEGLFNGRSRGKWLEGRRAAQDDSKRVTIDMLHMDPESFHYVLQFLYADVGEDLFDSVVADSIDDFSELVMDVMSIANELMLDRLSQICQKVLGRFVSTRNISTLMNLISPCSVTEFKKKGLEYICLQMETMLENHLLDNLDEELLLELDEVVRDNQLARCPFARSGRAEADLLEQNPQLAQDIQEERQIRLKEMIFKVMNKDDDRKISSSYKTRFGSFDDISGTSPTADRAVRRRSRVARDETFSPNLRPRDSHADLIFDMDEEESSGVASPLSPSPQPKASGDRDELDRLPSLSGPWQKGTSNAVSESPRGTSTSPAPVPRPGAPKVNSSNDAGGRSLSGGNPWRPSALPTTRLDLRQVLAESKPVQSALSAGLAAKPRETGSKPAPQKISQKEKKKQLMQQAELAAQQEKQQSEAPWTKAGEKMSTPWQRPTPAPAPSMTSLLHPDSASENRPSISPIPAEASSSRSIPRRAASPDTRFAGQRSNPPSRPSPGSSKTENQPIMPHSKSYIKRAPKQEQEMGLGLADIIGQQQREQETRREAVAKRSLQEIQQEQAFQEWWDQESRRHQEEEARRQAREESKDKKRERGGRRGQGGKAKGTTNNSRKGGNAPSGGGGGSTPTAANAAGPSSGSRIRGGKGKS